MAHTDKGNYAAKHPAGQKLNGPVVQAVRIAAHDNRISCATAHKIAKDCAVSPAEAGRMIDGEEVQITHCQLGIFKHSVDRPARPTNVELTPELEKTLVAGVINRRLPCIAAWSIAESFNLTRPQIGAACDKLGIKINTCQLVTFD